MKREVDVSDHICIRYIERFNPNLNAITDYEKKMQRARIEIKSILESARYVSDSREGILLYSPVHKCNIIVRNRVLITLYKPSIKEKNRERKAMERQFKRAANE